MSQVQSKKNKNTKLEIRVFIFFAAKCRKCTNTKARTSQIQNQSPHPIVYNRPARNTKVPKIVTTFKNTESSIKS